MFGRRSIRLIHDLEEYQLIQLRAIIRASVHGKVRLMRLFITTLRGHPHRQAPGAHGAP